jgi:nucleoside-diphosphate-sugar epimerase
MKVQRLITEGESEVLEFKATFGKDVIETLCAFANHRGGTVLIGVAVSHPAAAGRVFNVTDGEFHILKEIIESICAALGRKPPRLSVPVGPARFMAGLMEDAFRLVGRKSPIGRDTIDKYTEDIAVDGSLIQKELGFVPLGKKRSEKCVKKIVLSFELLWKKDVTQIKIKMPYLSQSTQSTQRKAVYL